MVYDREQFAYFAFRRTLGLGQLFAGLHVHAADRALRVEKYEAGLHGIQQPFGKDSGIRTATAGLRSASVLIFGIRAWGIFEHG